MKWISNMERRSQLQKLILTRWKFSSYHGERKPYCCMQKVAGKFSRSKLKENKSCHLKELYVCNYFVHLMYITGTTMQPALFLPWCLSCLIETCKWSNALRLTSTSIDLSYLNIPLGRWWIGETVRAGGDGRYEGNQPSQAQQDGCT